MNRKLTLLALLALLFTEAFAQDTTVIKRQANAMAQAVLNKTYDKTIDGLYPAFITMSGGKVKLKQQLSKVMSDTSFTIIKAVIGSPGEIYKAGSELHCLVPETITIKVPQGTAVSTSHLLAISKDGGKKWYFLDVNSTSKDRLPKLLPFFNKNMVLPARTQPVFYPNN